MRLDMNINKIATKKRTGEVVKASTHTSYLVNPLLNGEIDACFHILMATHESPTEDFPCLLRAEGGG